MGGGGGSLKADRERWVVAVDDADDADVGTYSSSSSLQKAERNYLCFFW